MATVEHTLTQALAQHRAGDLVQARELYCQVLTQDAEQPDAWHLLGMVAHQAGDNDLAAQLIGKALALRPGDADFHNNLGVVLRAAGNLPEAAASHRWALQLRPDCADAHNNLGVTLLEQDRVAEAEAVFRRALELRAEHLLARMNLGNSLQKQGRFQEAATCYEAVLAQQPDHAETLANLANVRLRLGDLEGAAAAYQRARHLRPDLLEASTGLAMALGRLGRLHDALAIQQEVYRRQPNLPSSAFHLACTLQDLNRLDEAALLFEETLRLEPDHVLAHCNLGVISGRLGKISQAIECFEAALRDSPDNAAAASNRLFHLTYDSQRELAAVFEEHRAWGTWKEQAVPRLLPHANDPAPGRPLRIGYVSPDFRQHVLVSFFEPILRHHDPTRVLVTCYAEVQRPDATTERLRQLAQRWRWTCEQSDEEVESQIRADGIDILIDLAGHTPGNRLGVFARGPAPVQATWMGYPFTTGLTRVDYFLSDAVVHPPGEPTWTTEEVVRLPHGVCCYAPPENAPPVAPLPALTRGHLTFGSLHNLGKLNDSVLDLWARLLRAVPSARLLLFRDTLVGSVRESLRRRLQERGLDDARLDLRHEMPASGHLTVYHDIDVSLDVFPYGGGTTSYESLWMGVPTLTLFGERIAGRAASSLLARAGLADFIARTPDEYVARGVQLAASLGHLADLRAELRATMTTRVCDGTAFTRSLEDVYQDLWRRWCAGCRRTAC